MSQTKRFLGFVTTLALGLATGAAHAQEAAPADLDAYCQDHWLAVDRCHDRPWNGLRVVFGLDLGASKFVESGPFGFGNGTGSVTDAGPSWGVRAGVELLPWLTLEGRYAGMYNGAQAQVSPAGTVGFLTSAADAVAMFTAPLPYVHPYVLGGVGYYAVSLTGSATAKAATPLLSSSQPAIPMGVGVDVPLSSHLSVGAEAVFHFLVGETLASVSTNKIDGGDLTTFSVVGRLRL